LRREIAVARALGASNRDLRRRFLPEGLALALAAGLLSLPLASVAIATRFGFQAGQIPRLNELRMDLATTTFVLILTGFSGLLLGSVAIFSARRVDTSAALMVSFGRVSSRPQEQRWRRVLVVTQVALTLPLLIGSALMSKSFFKMIHVDLGFQPADAITFTLSVPPTNAKSGDFYHDVAEIHSRLLGRLRALPGIDSAEAATNFPLTPKNGNDIRIAGRDNDVENLDYCTLSYAIPGYFRVMGIPILRGRGFEENDLAVETPGAILSASLARSLFGREDVVGKQVRLPGSGEFPPYTIVGVVGDIATRSIVEGPAKLLYFPHIYPPRAQKVTDVISIYIPDAQSYIVRTRLPVASLARPIQRIVREIEPTLALTQISTVRQRVDDSMARARLTMLLLGIGAATALFLASTGLYGVLAYAVGQRTSEFGIRMALGATPAMIVRAVIGQGVVLALAGIAVGTLATVWLTGFVGTLLYQVSPNDPVIFAVSSISLIAIASLACYLPAHRAGKTEPAKALKAE
jgi:putative ABC transport system permease protein